MGTGGALPTPHRNPSAIVVNREGELLLFDCGEGTQQQMMRARTGMMKLTSIFVTHFHADHFLGIAGLVQTMAFQGREAPLSIYGPKNVHRMVEHLLALGYFKLTFDVAATELSPGDKIGRDEYDIIAVGNDHGLPSLGYVLEEHMRRGRFNRARAEELGVPPGPLFAKLHSGEPVEIDGQVVRSEEVVGPPRKGRKLIYSGDTRPCEGILKAAENADLLIHDGTLGSDQAEWAVEAGHSTAVEAAEIAKKADVKQLVLTHISSRYSEGVEPLLKEAQQIFENTIIAEEMMVLDIPYPE